MQGPVVPFFPQQLPQVTSVLKTQITQTVPLEASLQSSPAREEGEVPESELDPDTRRRLLILQHGHDSRDRASSEPQFPVPAPLQVPALRSQTRGWFPEEEMGLRQVNRVARPKEFPLSSEPLQIEKQRPHHPPFHHKMENAVPPDRVFLESQRTPKEVIVISFHLFISLIWSKEYVDIMWFLSSDTSKRRSTEIKSSISKFSFLFR